MDNTEDTIKLGLMPPLTGLVSIYGEEISRAAQIACQEVNNLGGVLGRPLELVIEDDGSLPESAVAVAEKLVEQHRCKAIIGNLLSNSRIAVAYRVAEPRKIPLLNFSFYEGSILSRYFFHFAALPNQQIDQMIPYMHQQFGPRMFFAGNNYEWPRGSIHAAKLSLSHVGGEVVGEEYCPIGVDALSIDRLLDHVEAAAPDVFIPYFAGADQILLLTRFTERGMKKRMAVVMGHYDEMMASKLPAEVREGFYSSNTYFMSVDTAENHDCLARLARMPGVDGLWPRGNGILTNFGEGAYVCVKAFAQAANAAGSLDAEALVNALKSSHLAAPQGMVQMNPEHHHARVNTWLSRCRADGSFEIVKQFGAIEPVLPERYRHQRISLHAALEDDIRLQARMLEQMSDGVLLVNSQERAVTYANASAERIFGYEPGAMKGLSMVQLSAVNKENPLKTFAEIFEAINQTGAWQGDVRTVKADGTPIWCSVTFSIFTHPVQGEVWLGICRDITSRKQAETSLRIKDAAIASSINAMVIVELDGKISYVNQAFVDLWRLPDAIAAIGQTPAEFWDRPEESRVVKEALRHQGHWQGEFRARLHDGTLADLQLSASMVTDESGEPLCMLGAFVDVTEQRRAEVALRENEEKYRRLVEGLGNNHCIFSHAPEGEFLYVGPGFKALFGVQDMEIVGRNWRMLNLTAESLRAGEEADQRLLTEKTAQTVELTCIHPDGSQRIIEVNYAPVFANEKIVAMEGICSDITERVQTMDALRRSKLELKALNESLEARVLERTAEVQRQSRRNEMILSTAIDGFFSADETGRFCNVNPAFCAMLGYSEVELLRMSISEIEATESPDEVADHIERVMSRGHDRFDTRHSRKDGSLIEIEISVSLVEIGSEKRFYAFVRDITPRKETQAALSRARDEAERANAAKSEFLSRMSHELRTPLNAILGFGQLLEIDREHPLTESQAENVHEILHGGEHLLELVNEVLDLARIESGRLVVNLEAVAIAPLIKACVAQIKPLAEQRAIAIVLVLDAPCTAQADIMRFKQVLLNLLSNAIKYNRDGGSIRVGCAESGGRLRISVQDTGHGIAAESLPRLFRPFERLESAYQGIDGTGIGLALAKRLVEGMHGEIGVESTIGVGSTFWVELPVAAPERIQETPLSPSIPKAIRVLVAEDYAPNQALLKLQLTSLGCQVEIAPDGAEALEKWIEGRHDLILTDLNMPVMDGLALTQAVRQHEKISGGHTPIIAITAAVVPLELKRCRDAGMDEVLTKPLSLDAVRHVLARWTGSESLPQESSSLVALKDKDGEEEILDIEHLYHILGAVNPEHARELIALFLQSATDGLDRLSIHPDDLLAVAHEMHKQKSSARTVGALRYARHAEMLEQQAREGNTISLDVLRNALAQVKTVGEGIVAEGTGSVIELPGNALSVSCASVLVVDDDPVVLRQMVAMLSTLGVAEVLTAGNGFEALKEMGNREDEFEVLVCDLNMPEMDGVELIRLFGKTGYKGGLILMSGADEKVINTASTLAELQGLNVLGQVQKPVEPKKMAELLAHLADSPVQIRLFSSAPIISPQAIRDGIAGDEFAIWFQPKVDALSLRPVGVEALARWQRPDGSFVPPDVFVTVAEHEGVIGELSKMLVSRALMEGAKLHEAGFPLKIAVNLSALWLDDLNLPDFILATVQAAGLKASDMILEVTETGVMEDLTTALDVLTRARLKGFGLSIDDFGIGYSSFEQLGRIPFTELKLDQSFVSRGRKNATARAVLESSMDMARKLGLFTVAEGVETQADLDLVRTLGCDLVQGYLVAKPMSVGDLLKWLRIYGEK